MFKKFLLKITDRVRYLHSYESIIEILKMHQVWESFENISKEDKVYYENLAKYANKEK